jgi:hypothetical protein
VKNHSNRVFPVGLQKVGLKLVIGVLKTHGAELACQILLRRALTKQQPAINNDLPEEDFFEEGQDDLTLLQYVVVDKNDNEFLDDGHQQLLMTEE